MLRCKFDRNLTFIEFEIGILARMTSEIIRPRSEILNTQVITRNSGKRIGVVKELLVDIDRREVVALGLRDSLISLAGMPRFMLLSSIQKIGDVILVEDENVIEDIDVEAYSNLIGSETITETGDLLGKVRGFKFNVETGELYSLIIASLGIPQIPEQMLSTYELPIDEIVSSGPNRLIVFEGAQDRLTQLSVGVMERLGIGEAPWEKNREEEFLTPKIRIDNQLGTGKTIPEPEPVRFREADRERESPARVVEEAWSEDEWGEPESVPVPEPISEAMYYEEELEEDNWNEGSRGDRYEDYRDPVNPYPEPDYPQEYDYPDVEADAWADEGEQTPYTPPRVNIPQKQKAPEYEEEPGY